MKSIGRKKAPPPPPAWHPDFCDPARLPDIKPVRTSFFVNVLAVTLVVVGIIGLGYVEMRRGEYGDQISVLEAQLAENRGRNQEVLRMYRDYVAEQRQLEEILGFYETPSEASRFLEGLGDSLPDEILVSNVRYTDYSEGGDVVGKQAVVNGSVRGTPDEASTRVSVYLNTLQEHPSLSRNLERAQLTSLAPASEGGLMAFGIQLVYRKGDE